MYIPTIPEIDGFAELYDLLRNEPVLQKRMNDMNELLKLINQRIGIMESVQDLRSKQAQAAIALDEARVVKITAEEQAAQLRARMEREYDDHKKAMIMAANDIKRRIGEVEDRESEVSSAAGQNAINSADLAAKELTLSQLDSRLNDAAVALTKREMAIVDKLASMKAIWDG